MQRNLTPYVKACDPNNPNYAFYETEYTLTITSLTADKNSYMPGDTATISGTVSLQAVDVYYSSDCNEYSYGQPYQVDPTGVVLALSTGATTVAGSSGAFSFTVPIATDAAAGNMQYTVTATHTPSGASDSGTVTLAVGAYSPKLAVTGSDTYYPGDTIVFAGAGWIPGQPVTVQFLGLQAQETGPTFSDQFVIPDDASEGAASISASQSPNLQTTTSITIQWRPLSLAVDSLPVSLPDGSSVTVTGSVTSNNGPVPGAQVTVTYASDVLIAASESMLTFTTSSSTTTDSAGKFSVTFTIPQGAWATRAQSNRVLSLSVGQNPTWPGDHDISATITATATKSPGYKSPSNTATFLVYITAPQAWVPLLNDLAPWLFFGGVFFLAGGSALALSGSLISIIVSATGGALLVAFMYGMYEGYHVDEEALLHGPRNDAPRNPPEQ